jgi:AbiV family abortive infection protein
MAKPDDKALMAFNACVVHARDLLESAKAVQVTGRNNIAYHLATLALEEMGKRELYRIQESAKVVGEMPTWQADATQDHVKKLFWCFYSLGGIPDMIDQRQFFEKRDAAADVHANRVAGLYVENGDGGLNVPSNAISSRQSLSLIGLAESLIQYAESQKPRDDIPQEEIDLQIWFLNAVDDPEIQKRIFTTKSFEKLKQLNDVVEWTRSIKAELEASDKELRELAERELRREPKIDGDVRKDRWKIRLRIETTSNSIRPAAFKDWNKSVEWIKLFPVQGAKKKEQLIVELTLGDDIPAAALWGMGFSLSLQFLIAINMATSGFWWWPIGTHTKRFYESIRDLETGHGFELDSSGFRVFTHRPALTPVHMQNLLMCFTALPHPHDPQRSQAYKYYLGGLNFIAINSIQWRCDGQAFGNFLESFKLLMTEASYSLPSDTADTAIGRFLNEKYPRLDLAYHATFLELVRNFEQRSSLVVVKIDDVYFIKLLCETIFRDTIIPELRRRKIVADELTTPAD